MSKNLWQKERGAIFRNLVRQYSEEGYNNKEAKRLARQEVDEKGFEDEKSRITSSLLNQKRQAAIGGFLTHLREKSEITVEEEFLD